MNDDIHDRTIGVVAKYIEPPRYKGIGSFNHIGDGVRKLIDVLLEREYRTAQRLAKRKSLPK